MKEGVESAEGKISGFHFTSSGKTPIKNFKAKGVDQRRFEKKAERPGTTNFRIFIVPCPEQLSSTCHFIIRYQKVQLLFFAKGFPSHTH